MADNQENHAARYSGKYKKRKLGVPSEGSTPSASALAKNNANWIRWAAASNIDPDTHASLPTEAATLSAIMGEGKVPMALKSISEEQRQAVIAYVTLTYPPDVPVLLSLLQAVSEIETASDTSEGVETQLVSLLPEIVRLIGHLRSLKFGPERLGGPIEAEWRLPIDSLSFGIFQGMPDVAYRHDFNIVIPRSNMARSPDTATLDSVVILHARTPSDQWTIDAYTLAEEASCTASLEPNMRIPVIQHVVKYKRDGDGFNELAYGLATAQRQRHAMGLHGHLVYGISMTKHIAKAYVAWSETLRNASTDQFVDELPLIHIGILAELDLCQPLHAIQFALFLLTAKADMESKRHLFDDLVVNDLRSAQRGFRTWKASMCPPPNEVGSEVEEDGEEMEEEDEEDEGVIETKFWVDHGYNRRPAPRSE